MVFKNSTAHKPKPKTKGKKSSHRGITTERISNRPRSQQSYPSWAAKHAATTDKTQQTKRIIRSRIELNFVGIYKRNEPIFTCPPVRTNHGAINIVMYNNKYSDTALTNSNGRSPSVLINTSEIIKMNTPINMQPAAPAKPNINLL